MSEETVAPTETEKKKPRSFIQLVADDIHTDIKLVAEGQKQIREIKVRLNDIGNPEARTSFRMFFEDEENILAARFKQKSLALKHVNGNAVNLGLIKEDIETDLKMMATTQRNLGALRTYLPAIANNEVRELCEFFIEQHRDLYAAQQQHKGMAIKHVNTAIEKWKSKNRLKTAESAPSAEAPKLTSDPQPSSSAPAVTGLAESQPPQS